MEKKKKRKKIGLIILLVIVILLIVGVASCAKALSNTNAAVVTTTHATKEDIQASITTSGNVEAEIKKTYFAKVSGNIGSVNVAAGDWVAAGDTLLDYEMSDLDQMKYQAELQQKRSNAVYQEALHNNSESQAKLNEANHNLPIIEQQIAADKETLKQLQKEANNNGLLKYDISDAEYGMGSVSGNDANGVTGKQIAQNDIAISDKISAVNENLALLQENQLEMEQQKSASEAAVMDGYIRTQYDVDNELAKISYEQSVSDYNLASEGIKAEFAGIITECNIIEGAPVVQGTQLLTLESSDKVKITFNASKHDLENLEVGQKVDITIAGNQYEGEVSKINRMAQLNQSGAAMVGAEVHIKNPDEKIILGLNAKLFIYTDSAKDALVIPSEAINADRDGDFVYVVENGIIVKRPVVCGISTDTQVQILEGIGENDEIVLSALTNLEEGMTAVAMPQTN